jgi:hypothetical protein
MRFDMNNEMNEILGGPIGFDNTIPGSVPVEGKEFVYFADDKKSNPRKQFNLLTQYSNPPHAKNGAVTTQGCTITLPDSSKFYAIAYRGDIAGWRKDIEEGAFALSLSLGKIESEQFVVSDGRVFPLCECKVQFG